MKNILLCLLLFTSGNILAQEKPVSQEEFKEFRKEMKDSIRQIGKRVDNGAETLKVAKEYSDRADKLISNFYAFLGVVAAFLGIGLIAVYRSSVKKLRQTLDQKFSEQQKEIDRVLFTEKRTKYIKDNAHVLIIHKGEHSVSTSAFIDLEETIFTEFKNTRHISVNSFIDLPARLTEFSEDKKPLKIILMNDDLFNGLEKEKINGKSEFTSASKRTIDESFDLLKKHEVGLVLFGKTFLDAFELPYLAFSNQPYSAYTNINNLLKYMMVAKKIQA